MGAKRPGAREGAPGPRFFWSSSQNESWLRPAPAAPGCVDLHRRPLQAACFGLLARLVLARPSPTVHSARRSCTLTQPRSVSAAGTRAAGAVVAAHVAPGRTARARRALGAAAGIVSACDGGTAGKAERGQTQDEDQGSQRLLHGFSFRDLGCWASAASRRRERPGARSSGGNGDECSEFVARARRSKQDRIAPEPVEPPCFSDNPDAMAREPRAAFAAVSRKRLHPDPRRRCVG